METKREDKNRKGILTGKTFRPLIEEMVLRFGEESARDYLVLSYFQLRTQNDVLSYLHWYGSLNSETDLERYKQEFVATGAKVTEWYDTLFKVNKETEEREFSSLSESQLKEYSKIKKNKKLDKLHISGGILSSQELKFYIPILVERFGIEPTLNFLRLSYFRLLNYNRYIASIDDGKFRRMYRLSNIKEYMLEFQKLCPNRDFLERMKGYAIYEH